MKYKQKRCVTRGGGDFKSQHVIFHFCPSLDDASVDPGAVSEQDAQDTPAPCRVSEAHPPAEPPRLGIVCSRDGARPSVADTLGRRESQPSSLATCRDLTYLSSRPAHVCLVVCRPSVSPSRVETSPKQRLPLRSLLSGVSMCLSCELMNIAQDVNDINKCGLSPRHSVRISFISHAAV